MDELTRIFRAESGKLVASLMCFSQDMQLAEDALQDACEQASTHWPVQGIPVNCGAWLHLVAKRKLIDKLRQVNGRNEQQKIALIEQAMYCQPEQVSELDYDVPDERLRLIFTCCHPALNEDAQVALTLKTLCGLTVKEIARAYLTSEVAMGQRVTRAKRKIKTAGISYEVPSHAQISARLASVLKVIYLIYNESYSAYEGQALTRQDLAQEAIRLSRLMVELIPKAEVLGNAALILFHDARRKSRTTSVATYIPLELQDRNLWDMVKIQEASILLNKAMSLRQPGPYQLQAAISALHSTAATWEETDWYQIQLLYLRLLDFNDSAVVVLNLLVAMSYCGELEKAYQELLLLEPKLNDYQPYYAARSDIESRMQLTAAAILSLEKAIKLSKNGSERDFLIRKRAVNLKS
ncbi:RNA polymerase sigma factor [Paraglaciecola marina]|uniref:RNA polymerase sigma factor n=1 Tax=Paraglaciecola marina TaxID=2500157 RepID=UPI00105C27A9|nr:sigma-70 family RNA polymerase sigma factor [Paraglaciecola marina]